MNQVNNAILWLIVAATGLALTAAPEQEETVRVAVVRGAKTFGVSVRGPYTMIDLVTGQRIDEGKRLQASSVTASRAGIVIGGRDFGVRRLRIIAQKDVMVAFGGKERRYRDRIDILMNKDDTFLVVNMLGLEDYVRGVLYHEVPHRWPMSAIMAQAVAARTYALYQVRHNKVRDFDVTSDVYSQVYGGRSAERYRTNIAVGRTSSEVLTYQGEVLPAYFHSHCGGHTEDASELWKHDLPPLKGVRCVFCKGLPNDHWKRNFRSKDVQEKLITAGIKLGLIKEIVVSKRTKSGRVKELTIHTRDGKSVRVFGNKFREALGPNALKSNMYDVVMQGWYFDIIGSGWGHGVGMCQWGAYGMAKQRYDYRAILEHYYPGAKITKVADL